MKEERPVSLPTTVARARVSHAVRRGDVAAERTARQDLAEVTLENHIQRTLAAAPPLRPEQRKHLAHLVLLGGGSVE